MARVALFHIRFTQAVIQKWDEFGFDRSLAGDIHFDDDEVFTLGIPRGVNLLLIAIHDIGHSLGLAHSFVRDAMMSPFYQDYQGLDFSLTNDDIAGIQSIYGIKTYNVSSEICPHNLSGIFRHSGEVYLIENNKLYVLENDLTFKKGPMRLDSKFAGLDRADAVYVNKMNHIVFFKGTQYYVYDRVSYPRLLMYGSIYTKFRRLKSKVKKVDAAFYSKKDGYTYLFDGEECYFYEESLQYIRRSNSIKKKWKGIPDNVHAILPWWNDVIYFFKGSKVYRYNDTAKSAQIAFDNYTINPWPQCFAGLIKGKNS